MANHNANIATTLSRFQYKTLRQIVPFNIFCAFPYTKRLNYMSRPYFLCYIIFNPELIYQCCIKRIMVMEL